MQQPHLGLRNGWLGRYTYNPLLLGKGHDEACRKPKGLHFYISISSPAISPYLSAWLHSWLLSSDAYGIFHASFDYLTMFLSLTKNRQCRFYQQIIPIEREKDHFGLYIY